MVSELSDKGEKKPDVCLRVARLIHTTLTFTPLANLELPVNLTQVSLWTTGAC